ncbi:MAG: glycosyltransferase family 4 protein, partial [Candidatus Helarchaeota archaeon]
KLKLLHCAPKLSISGAEFYFQRISEELSKNNDTTIIASNLIDFSSLRTGSTKTAPLSEKGKNGLKILRFPITEGFPHALVEKSLNTFIGDIISKIRIFGLSATDCYKFLINGPYSLPLFASMLKNPADVIHTIAIPYASVLYGLISAKLKKVPSVCTPFFHFENPRYHDPAYGNILQNYDAILSNSRAETRYLIDHAGIPSKKIKQIHMAVDLKKYEKAKESWFLNVYPKQGPDVLFVGHKNFEKGALSILDAIPHVVNEVPSVRFVFIGPSTKAFNMRMKSLKKNFRKNILNIGILPFFSTLKRGAFKAADIYVMPSRSEAFGICFLEAWACKKPVISSSIPAMDDVVRAGVDGLKVPFNCPPSTLGDVIIRLLKDDSLRQELGARGHQKIKEKGLTYEHLSKKIEEIHEELLS